MVKVITYGTYDLFHFGHERLLKRAKELGDYLIVGVTAEDFDKVRGKINVKQSLMERIENVKKTGLADEIIVEEYEGQKIDDIKKYDVDIFTVGSDWVGKFDYLNEFCEVVYLERTEGISSTEVRAKEAGLRFGVVGESFLTSKIARESSFVNGLDIEAIYSEDKKYMTGKLEDYCIGCSYEEFLDKVDAIYIGSHPSKHYDRIKAALLKNKHVLYESPLTLKVSEAKELIKLAEDQGVILMEATKTAYATAYHRLLLQIKSGKIGEVVSVDATCTSMLDFENEDKIDKSHVWNGICSWGPAAMLPILQILGTEYDSKSIVTKLSTEKSEYKFDKFTKIDFVYPNAVASMKVGTGVKSEGELIISGTKGYIYVPAPWWKTDYFEIRFENPADNKRFFYQLEGEGIRYELVAFVKAIGSKNKKLYSHIGDNIALKITEIIEDFNNDVDLRRI